MSRARVHEVSSPISLFPFIGILLCTMGALLVILVAVSRSARDTAQQQVQTAHRSTEKMDESVQKKMDYVQRYVGSLNSVRSEAERKLRNEHLRLSHVEDHIRRLQEEMRSLQLAAVELEAMEKEHYDDRAQAERETNRLHQLIDESRKSITSLQEAADEAPSSYAVVPYEGPNGTFRRPIYIECVKDGVVLQPEGIHIAADDLRPPYGAGNPLAAALRASRDHLVRLYPTEGQSRATEPYPLLLVRSEGLIMFDRARQAIEAGDFDLGFELVEDDWKLKFPQPDPQLASIQQTALEQARARQEVLAAAAPRAYRGRSMGSGNDSGFDDEPSDGSDDGGFDGGYGDGGSGGGGGGVGDGNSSGDGFAGGGGSGRSSGSGSGGSGSGGGEQTPAGGSASGGTGNGGAGQGGAALAGGGSASGTGGYAASADSGASGGVGGAASGNSFDGGGTPMAATSDPNAQPDANQQQNVSTMMGSPPPDGPQDFASNAARGKNQPSLAETRGKDWALRQKPQRAIPIRRTIRVVVRQDQLAILPDDPPGAPDSVAGKVIPMQGDTVQSLDEFVKQVRDEIDGWGMAGNGLYWRPVVLLSVGPQGQNRASDLERLLKNSGLELRTDETAHNAPPRKVQ